MGEEVKKPEEKKVEEPKKEEEKKKPAAEEPKKVKTEEPSKDEKKPAEESKDGKKEDEAAPPPPPPPPEEIVMRVYMHCEGCAKKVQRSLKGFEGVESVSTDCRTHKVVVKGKVAAADPLKVVDRVQKKTGRKVELLTPIPPKPEKVEEKEEEKPKPEEKKEEPQVVTVVLKVHMHCEACSLEIKKRILKMKGVQSADPDLKASQVTVKGVMDPQKLVEYVYKRTGKHAAIVKRDPPEKKPEEATEAGEKGKEEKDKKEEKDGGADGEKKGVDGDKAAAAEEGDKAVAAAAEEAAAKVVELKRNELYYSYPRMNVEYAYPPQIFSDENPNACVVM